MGAANSATITLVGKRALAVFAELFSRYRQDKRVRVEVLEHRRRPVRFIKFKIWRIT